MKQKHIFWIFGIIMWPIIIATPLVVYGTTMEAIGFMVFVSIGKEVVDAKMRFSTPNATDALFTFLPTLLLLAVKLVS